MRGCITDWRSAFPPLEATADPMSRLLNRRYLASAIRAARRETQQGDIFTPDVADLLRTRLAQMLAGHDISMVTGPRGDESWPADAPVVNEPFREEASRAVPTPFLQALPPLPGDIEYRIVETDLVLWDVHADIVIDVLPGCVPHTVPCVTRVTLGRRSPLP
jgi:hypothetical protein